MATIAQEISQPSYAKNIVAYEVEQGSAHDQTRLRLFVETSPYSASYEFVTELKGFPDADDKTKFYIQDLFERDLLNYDKPDFFNNSKVAPNICRRVQAKVYDFDESDLDLIDEAYQNTSSTAYVDIETLTNTTDYIVIVESDEVLDSGDTPRFREDGASAKTATFLYSLGDEQWFEITSEAAYNEVRVAQGKKVTIYEGSAPTLTTSSTKSVLLAGRRFLNYLYDGLQAPSFSDVSHVAEQEFLITFDKSDVNTHNLTLTDRAYWYIEAQYSFNGGIWQAWESIQSNQSFSSGVEINEDPDIGDTVQFRMRPYTIPDGETVIDKYGPWEYSDIIDIFSEYITVGGSPITVGGSYIKI